MTLRQGYQIKETERKSLDNCGRRSNLYEMLTDGPEMDGQTDGQRTLHLDNNSWPDTPNELKINLRIRYKM